MNNAIITLDGPSGSGKGTLGKQLAQYLGWHFLDSGALYRILAYVALQKNIDLRQETELATLARVLEVRFEQGHIYRNQEEISLRIREESCGKAASQISSFSLVRAALLARQRAFAIPPGLVADGRDMGSVVFPEAKLKFYIDATPEIRAQRRLHQLQAMGMNANLDSLLEDILARDHRDKTRAVAPLVIPSGAIVVDTTNKTIPETFAFLKAQVNRILGESR